MSSKKKRKAKKRNVKSGRRSNAVSSDSSKTSPLPESSLLGWASFFDPQRYPRWFRIAFTGCTLALSMVVAAYMFIFLLIGVLLILPLERLFKRVKQPIRRPELFTDILHVFVTVALVAVPAYLIASVAASFRVEILADAIASQPIWLQGAEAFFFRELVLYWAHRISHRVTLLWRFHAVHHSSRKLDWIAGQRRHPIDFLYIRLCSDVAMALAGFSPAQLGLIAGVAGLWDMTIHANIRWRLKWLDGIWVTQEYHHWHHSRLRENHDANYAAAFAFLDVVFGTYRMPKDQRPSEYGIEEKMPGNYLGQLVQPFLPRKPRVDT